MQIGWKDHASIQLSADAISLLDTLNPGISRHTSGFPLFSFPLFPLIPSLLSLLLSLHNQKHNLLSDSHENPSSPPHGGPPVFR